jgi:hypothetical protein
MSELHYNIHNNGNANLSKVLSSIENALIIGRLTNRKVFLYGADKLKNSNLSIFDLFDIKSLANKNELEIVNSNNIEQSIPALEHDFENSCIFYEKNGPDKDFLLERTKILDLAKYESQEKIRTINNNTFGNYSFLFYLTKFQKEEIHDYLKANILPNNKYVNLLAEITTNILKNQNYYSIHVRRQDYLTIYPNLVNIKCENFINVIKENIKTTSTLLVHTDENDKNYFSCLQKEYSNLIFIDDIINTSYKNLEKIEKDFLSLMIAARSEWFIGSLYSSFTSTIQKYRKYQNKMEKFLYLYDPAKKIDILSYGKIKEDAFGRYTWNRLKVPKDLALNSARYREWGECIRDMNYNKQQILVIPNFLDEKTCDYLAKKIEEKPGNEHMNHTNRDRIVLSKTHDKVVQNIAIRISKRLNLDYSEVHDAMQLFRQYTGGQTPLHTDSIYESNKARRSASILFYLNEGYHGAYLDFPYLNIRIKPHKGIAIFYPLINEYDEQDILWSHSASVITKGVKIMCYFNLQEKSTD